MSNGYPPSASPLGGSPSPGPSPALGVGGGGGGGKAGNPSRHSPQPPPPPHPHRANLRVVIPAPLTQSLSDDNNYDVSLFPQIFIYIFIRMYLRYIFIQFSEGLLFTQEILDGNQCKSLLKNPLKLNEIVHMYNEVTGSQ